MKFARADMVDPATAARATVGTKIAEERELCQSSITALLMPRSRTTMAVRRTRRVAAS
eukprot:CAMPEP_0197929342 /NCGR_PEP_ID=MMETSP1439-20131203/103679_1 /TAXON_ID=66791 /ORGANISM="Gonyaulax spinifera, Strain CCMP409" /LENGTH=57 /DNA_ID=CAMNT_0043551977 /DNA_START=73 /DNA_END=243 /DNA_ORIENTATION=-